MPPVHSGARQTGQNRGGDGGSQALDEPLRRDSSGGGEAFSPTPSKS